MTEEELKTYRHPIAPPPELVQKWASEWTQKPDCSRDLFMTTKAAQWGADREVLACCKVLDDLNDGYWSKELRVRRRPKPQSLKEQSVALLDKIQAAKEGWDISELDIIRRALEQLPDPTSETHF